MKGIFGSMFDLNHDGNISLLESTMEFIFLNELLKDDSEERTELENEIPAGRFAAPGEVAEMILKLIEAPDYLTGQVITSDGGYL